MRVPLNGGAYTARSVIAGAQRCVNLIPETVPASETEPAQLVHYPTPGLTLLGTAPRAVCRGLYRSRLGTLYGVYGTGVYKIGASWTFSLLGSIAPGTSRVSMADNGVLLVIVDGTAAGYCVTIATDAFAAISDPAFYGADTVDYFATYFIFNKPGLPQYYVSDSNAVTFDSLYFANMAGYQDPIMGLVQLRGTLCLIGQLHTEWWTTSGAVDFPFQVIPTANVEHGCCARYSIAKADNAIFWLSQDEQGQGIAMISRGYAVDRISTHAIEAEWRSYSRIDDATGYTRQHDGHTLYVLTFPTANRTWAYDLASKLWHEWASGGTDARHRGQCAAFAYGRNVVGDYATGALYAVDPGVYTDNGAAIPRLRSFPHIVSGANRILFPTFIADMECGTSPSGAPLLTLEWSDDRGKTFTGLQTASFGGPGDTLTSLQFQRTGMARDRVYRLSWDAPVNTALMGAWVKTKASGS